MIELTLVTGSKDKLASWQRNVPPGIRLRSEAINQVEIQCACGKFRGMTIRSEVSLGEALRHILALDSRKLTI